uniref:Uncharacterized protein n=1 Tax=Arundo donax TaxID=35708 RepID=A0A0A9B398_ARUDO
MWYYCWMLVPNLHACYLLKTVEPVLNSSNEHYEKLPQ